MIDEKEYSASATCLTDSLILVIKKDDFTRLAQENQELKHKISRSLALLLLSREEGFQVNDLGIQVCWVS